MKQKKSSQTHDRIGKIPESSTPNDVLDRSGQSRIGSSQVDALEDQKDRLTNGLEKLRATSEQAHLWACHLSLRIRWWQLLKDLGGIFIPNLREKKMQFDGCIFFKWVGGSTTNQLCFFLGTKHTRMVGFYVVGDEGRVVDGGWLNQRSFGAMGRLFKIIC